jgi:uncharacterized Zn-binding protein involved in type VI secretion
MTAHGGVITTGFPTVLIGGLPAARITDMHACPMVTGLVPHVGGPIITGAWNVLTGSMPQARVTDKLICVGPTDVIVKGEVTVLVGTAGGGGAGGVVATIASSQIALRSPAYPRAVVMPDSSVATEFSKGVFATGTPEQQAETVRQLVAVRAGDGGPEFFDSLAERDEPVVVRVIGDPARGRELHPGRQSYDNCTVQSAQQIIRQKTGWDYTESEMEQIAVKPDDSGYERRRGTPWIGRKTILGNGGVPARDQESTIANVNSALANNQGVLSGHYSGRLWGKIRDGSPHTVHTTGAIQDKDGNTLAYTINDTYTDQRGRVITADVYEHSLTSKPITVTVNPIR